MNTGYSSFVIPIQNRVVFPAWVFQIERNSAEPSCYAFTSSWTRGKTDTTS